MIEAMSIVGIHSKPVNYKNMNLFIYLFVLKKGLQTNRYIFL